MRNLKKRLKGEALARRSKRAAFFQLMIALGYIGVKQSCTNEYHEVDLTCIVDKCVIIVIY